MNNLWAIIPVKPFGEGKSRLAQRLDEFERGQLSKRLLTRVVKMCHAANVCAEVLVISRDDHVLSYARRLGASALLERTDENRSSFPSPNVPSAPSATASPHISPCANLNAPPTTPIDRLNIALRQGAEQAAYQGADALLVLPADLPTVTAADVTALAHAGQDSPCVVIAPSEDNGTNALLLHPMDAIEFAFGVDSFSRHQEQAVQQNIPFNVIHSSTLAFDVDRPADLDRYTQVDPVES